MPLSIGVLDHGPNAPKVVVLAFAAAKCVVWTGEEGECHGKNANRRIGHGAGKAVFYAIVCQVIVPN